MEEIHRQGKMENNVLCLLCSLAFLTCWPRMFTPRLFATYVFESDKRKLSYVCLPSGVKVWVPHKMRQNKSGLCTCVQDWLAGVYVWVNMHIHMYSVVRAPNIRLRKRILVGFRFNSIKSVLLRKDMLAVTGNIYSTVGANFVMKLWRGGWWKDWGKWMM